MAEKHYRWSLNGPYPIIKQHSIAKHDVLHAYLVAYIQTLVSHPSQETFKLTLVDGFAGGGLYRHEDDKREILGSPFRMLKAMEEADFLVNRDRRKKVAFLLDYFFIESHKGAFEVLSRELKERGYENRINKNIHIHRSCFEEQIERIIGFVKVKAQKSARAIFLLDQYGYSDVPTASIRKIVSELPGSEVILTFAVDSFLNYANDSPDTYKLLEKIGVSEVLQGRTIESIKASEKDWRLCIQSCLYQELVSACGARYYTVFFIRCHGGHGDYWLVHLSQHARARDVMTRVHWNKNNHFIHYGGAGIDMFHVLGYDPLCDGGYTGQSSLVDYGFCFDEPAKDCSIACLMEQIPRLIYTNPDGMTFSELFATTCNSSPASSEVYRHTLEKLLQVKEIDVISKEGKRRKSSNIQDTDLIKPPKHPNIFSIARIPWESK